MVREMQCAEESSDTSDKSAHLNDAVLDDEACDGCTHSEAQGDDARDAAESIYFG